MSEKFCELVSHLLPGSMLPCYLGISCKHTYKHKEGKLIVENSLYPYRGNIFKYIPPKSNTAKDIKTEIPSLRKGVIICETQFFFF